MDLTEKTLESKLVYDGKIMQVFNDTVATCDGHHTHREYVNHHGGASVLAIDDDNNVYFVQQYRYAYRKTLLEIPAGKLNKDEDPMACAVRELKEEIGATCKNIEKLGVFYPTPGYTNEPLYVYLAKGLVFGDNNLDPGEFLDVIKMPYKEAYDKVMNNEIHDGKTVIGILMFSQRQ